MRTLFLLFCVSPILPAQERLPERPQNLLLGPLAEERRTEEFAHRLLELARDWQSGETDGYFHPDVVATQLPNRLSDAAVAGTSQNGESRKGPPNLRAFLVAHGDGSPFVSLQPIASNRAKFEIVGSRFWSRGQVELAETDGKISKFLVTKLQTVAVGQPPFKHVKLDDWMDPAPLLHPTLGLAAYGAAVADVNGDGRMDLFVTGHDKNVLYRNEGSDGFHAIPVATPHPVTAPLFLDFDNDGDPDLFCSANGTQVLLENRNGKFVDISEAAGVAVKSIGFTATAGDINRDGVPDIYVAVYNNYGPVAPASWDNAHNGLPNLLFVSNGDGTYTESAAKYGVAGQEWSYSAQFLDVDEDGWLDLYVANDFGAGNNLFLRRGDRFVDEAKARGVWDGGYGMGVDFGDFDNDGCIDMYVTKMSSTAGNRLLDRTGEIGTLRSMAAGNTLYRGIGGGKFAATKDKFHAGWSWGGGFIDIDNDGFEDLYSPNGHMSGASEKDT